MSNGDEPDADSDADGANGDAASDGDAVDAESLAERLDSVESELEAAETEADLDEVEADLDGIESDLAAADLPEPDDEDEAGPREELESRVEDLRAQLEEARGPYADDAAETAESAQETIRSTRWTADGIADLEAAVEAFRASVAETLDADLAAEAPEAEPAALADALDAPVAAVRDAGLDPDEDADTVAELVEAADDLAAAVEDAQSYDDLSVRGKLREEGFYDVLGVKHKDYPPEWSALKEWEKRDDVEMVLLLMDLMGGSEFIERHCLESLSRMANADATDAMLERAEKRDKPAIEVLGKIGDEAALDTLHEYADGDPGLQRVTLKAIGEIGSEDSTQVVADQLAAEDDSVRSQAARSLGLIGDARAVDPLADVLADDDSQSVRASAAWALLQIGTESALEAAAEYADDRSYVVQTEAERAEDALSAPAA